MTAATLTRLPLNAGGAAAGSVLRGGIWTLARAIDGGFWAAAQFMRAPVAISCVVGIAGFSLLAGANALYFQVGRHPAPFFFSQPRAATPAILRPVMPAPRPRFQPTAIDAQTTGSVAGETPIGNSDVLALQKKLAALGLLAGTPDGLFGRRTAVAIRAFETKVGLQAHGKLTREVLAAVAAYPLPNGTAPVQPLPTPAPLVAAAPTKPAVTPQVPASAAPTTTALAAISASAARPASPSGLTAISVKTVPVYVQPDPVPLAPAQPTESLQQPADAQPQATAMVDAAPAPAVADQPQAVASSLGAIAPAAPSAAAPDTSTVAMNSPPAPAAVAAAATAPATTVASITPAATAPAQQAPANQSALTPAQKLAQQMGTLPPAATPVAAASPASTPPVADNTPSTDPALVGQIQRALASLGFLGQRIDGVAGEATAKAIRNFEEFYNYKETGQATPQLLQLLLQKGATI